MSEPFETFEHAGFTCELHPDWDAQSPDDWENLGKLHAFRSYWLNDTPGEPAPGDVQEARERERAGLTVRFLRAQGQTAVLFQFQDYGSSGARIHALDDDDDAIASGYIAGDTAKMLEDGPVDGNLRRALEGELKNWDDYFQGAVCGYVVRDTDCAVVDSCWGFYPDDEGDGLDYLRTEAREAAEGIRDERRERAAEVRRGWALAHAGREAMPV